MLREPPAKKRKSRFGPQTTQDKPSTHNSAMQVANDLHRRQEQALAVAAKLSQDLGLSAGSNTLPTPETMQSSSSFFQSSMLSKHSHSHSHHHNGLGFNNSIHEDKVYIPKDDYPNINFIGLILGPKGLNQKRLQSETGCRILVKGKGSSKNGIHDNESAEPLHVYVSSDSREKVQIGVDKINQLIRESTDKYVEGGMEVKEHRHNGYIDVEIPNSQIGVVIGKQGNNIQRIQDVTGATVMISPRNVPNNPLMKMITISGSTGQCEQALKEIYQTIDELKAFRSRLKRQQQHNNSYHQHNNNNNNQHYNNNNNRNYNNNNNNNDHHQQQHNDGNTPSHHRDYGTASYDPNFVYPDAQFDEERLPQISSGGMESGFCEIIIPNSVVGLIIGKNASNVKAMKDRTRCDIRVQKDEETLPEADTRLVALRGCVQSIQAARQEIAKVIHMAQAQKQGATINSQPNTSYQQQMMYQQMMYHNQMMYQQQMGYGQHYGQMGYNPYMSHTQQPPPPPAPPTNNPTQMHAAYMQQWTAAQSQIPPPPPPPLPANETATEEQQKNKKEEQPQTAGDANGDNNASTADSTDTPKSDNNKENTNETETTKKGEIVETENTAKNNPETDQKELPKTNGENAIPKAAPAVGVQQQMAAAQQQTMYTPEMIQQHSQMLQQYGYTPQQIQAFQQYPQYYQQQYAQYYQQYGAQQQQYPQYAQQQYQTPTAGATANAASVDAVVAPPQANVTATQPANVAPPQVPQQAAVAAINATAQPQNPTTEPVAPVRPTEGTTKVEE